MSVLVYRDKHTASVAAATLFAAKIISDPHSTVGLSYHPVLEPVFDSLSAMTTNGLLNWENVRIFQLHETLDEQMTEPIFHRLGEILLAETAVLDANYYAPYSTTTSVADACTGFEADILKLGGIDVGLLAIGADGSILNNPAGSELAPVTHVEMGDQGRFVTAGLTTVMQMKQLIVVAFGKECAETVRLALRGAIDDRVPAGILQLHANATFILDDEAASLL